MLAYLILDFRVTDLTTFIDYVEQIPAHIKRHGGRYIVEGLKPERIEGDWEPETMVVLEFPSKAHAQAFLTDPIVQPVFAIRHKSTVGNLILVEGGSWRDAAGNAD